ncbi:MAG: DUF6600 domain-containing protein [Candidatus Acidiferrales bacterium]
MLRSFCFSLLLLCSAVLVLTSAPRRAQASDLSYARIVRVSLVSGDVQLSRPGHPSWEAAAQNMPVTQGVTIGTNDGYAEIEFEDGTTAWISQNTLVQFTELALADGGRITKLTLAQGTMSILTALRRGDTFALSMSGETIAAPKNAFFRIDCFHDGASVSVLGGEVEVTSAAGTKLVPKGKTLAYRSKLDNVSLSANPKADDWDRWTVGRARTAQTETAQSTSYIDAPFSYGLADMSAYGGWNYFAGYGYGWQPYGMGSCWMPFMNGQWDFYPQLGWTWVSGEPWGWTPYHFGSWNYLPSNGWTWFPSEFGAWDPAPVDWYSAGNQVGWWPAAFSGGSPLMFEQIAGRCSGFAGAGYGASGNSRLKMARAVRPVRRPPSRLMLTTNRLGHSDSIGLFAYSDGDARKMPIRSAEPLENGKASGMAVFAVAGNPRPIPRMLVPTAPDMAHLQRSLVTGASVSAMKLNSAMPSAPREALRAVNAMPAPAMPTHRPAPLMFSRASNDDSMRGYSPQGSMGGASAYSAATARALSAPSISAAHASAGSAGKPH